MQRLARRCDCCYATKWVTIMSTLDASHTVGYCLYGTLLLRLPWTACPVQIRAHHHIDVYTDINYS